MGNLTTSYEAAKKIIKSDLESMSKKFITIGYYLKYIRDEELYTQDGFQDIWEFAQDTYGISKSTCSRWMAMNDKFSKEGNTPYLKEEFQSFGKSQLQEMLYLTDEQMEQAKPEMTAKEIRDIRTSPFENYTKNRTEVYKGQEQYVKHLFLLPGMEKSKAWLTNRIQELYGNNCEAVREWAEKYLPVTGSVSASAIEGKGIVIKDHEFFTVLPLYSFMIIYKDLFMKDDIPGQRRIEDYPEFLPENKVQQEEPQEEDSLDGQQESNIEHFTEGKEPYGWKWSELVKQYLKSAYQSEDASAEIKSYGERYQALKRREVTVFYDETGKTLFDVSNARLEEEYKYYFASEPEVVQQEETVAPAQQKQSPIERGCITGKNPHGTCVCCGNEGTVECCARCQEDCNGRCGWLEEDSSQEEQEEVVAPAQQEEPEWSREITPQEVLREEKEKLDQFLEAFQGEEPEFIRKQKIIVGALAAMVTELESEESEQEQPELPRFKNNDQRKEWLRNYKDWGIWYKDEHIGATYYKYEFENGAILIAEEYENHSQYTGVYVSSYLHLIGGPEAKKGLNGIGKWQTHENYSRHPNNETELVEFLKEIQKTP